MQSEYLVGGMTCDHCVSRVSEELGRLPGVGDVDVDLASGRVLVSSDRVLNRDDVVVALDEAGYELV